MLLFFTVVPYLTAMVLSSSSISVPDHVQTPQLFRFHSGLGGGASSATPTGSHSPKGLFCLNSPLQFFDSLLFLPWESLRTHPLKWYPSGAVSMATESLAAQDTLYSSHYYPSGAVSMAIWKLSPQDTLYSSHYYPLAARLCFLGKFPIKKDGGNESLWKNWIDFFFKCFVCGFYV